MENENDEEVRDTAVIGDCAGMCGGVCLCREDDWRGHGRNLNCFVKPELNKFMCCGYNKKKMEVKPEEDDEWIIR